MKVSASVGGACSSPGSAAVERLYKAADEALYASKKPGAMDAVSPLDWRCRIRPRPPSRPASSGHAA